MNTVSDHDGGRVKRSSGGLARRWQDDVLAYSAAVVAIAALVVSVWQGYATRKHNKLSVVPILFTHVDFTRSHEESGLILKNRGVGPGFLVSNKVYFVGKEEKHPMTREGWTRVLRDSGISTETPTMTWALEDGFVLDPQDSITLLRPPNGSSPEEVGHLKRFVRSDLGVEICYCSLYKECWRMIYRGDRVTNVAARCPSQ